MTSACEHRTGIAEVTGSNPVEALVFFRLLLSNCLNWKIYCDDHSSLLCYIREKQDEVLLVFDGYDEYRTGREAEEKYGSRDNSPISEIFHGNIFRHCTVLVTTRSSRGDEIREPADIQAKITGFNMPDREDFM